MRATDAHVGHFLLQLGKLSAGAMSPQDAMAKLEAYAPLLRQEFNAEAFGPEALAFVAARCKFFPAYGELCGHLRDWCRENRPVMPAFPAPVIPDRQPPTEQEKAAVRTVLQVWRQEKTEAYHRKLDEHDAPKPPRTAYLGDGTLLMLYDEQARQGNTAAAVRAEVLRRKMLAEFGNSKVAAE